MGLYNTQAMNPYAYLEECDGGKHASSHVLLHNFMHKVCVEQSHALSAHTPEEGCP